MNYNTPITDTNDPRILPEDTDFADYIFGGNWTVRGIANYRLQSICRAAGIMGNDPGNLEALVWKYRGGEDHGQSPMTWKDYAEELKLQLDEYVTREEELEELERVNLETQRLAAEERENPST